MYLYRRVVHHLRHRGMASLIKAVVRRVPDALVPRRARTFTAILPYVRQQRGFEIGGPSATFGRTGLLPLYGEAASLDNCNFATRTMWEGQLAEGQPFLAGGRTLGRQYIREALDLWGIPSDHYDFVCSAFALQHCANPLRALTEMQRVLRVGGVFVLLLPHKDRTFDHRRPVTTMEHLISDFANDVGEDDMTHIAEVLELHDLSRDNVAGTFEQFKARTLQNSRNRGVHHHVFDTRLAIQVLDHVGLELLDVELVTVDNIILIARKLPSGAVPDNSAVLAGAAAMRFERLRPWW